MNIFLARFKFLQEFSIKDISINLLPKYEGVFSVFSFRAFKNKRHIKNFIQHNVLLLLAVLLFSVVTRPVALDIAEMRGFLEESETKDELYDFEEEPTENENTFPFTLKMPPKGTDRRLTRAEMRWIFREELRLNAMKKVIATENERAHRAYSVMVRDFNARGANFKYELHDKTRAEEDIEAFKEEIIKNAMDEAIAYGWGKS